MPRFGGLNLGNVGGALLRNAAGSIANAVLPRSAFGGFGLDSGKSLNFPDQNAKDRKVSLRPKPGGANRVYGAGLLTPIKESNGLIWPYTPSITYNQPVNYTSMTTVHANQDFHVYGNTPAVSLQVAGDFTVQNQLEGWYAHAAIHFFRTVSKMNFGESDPNAGTPPPVLLFNAYGPFVFNDVPVIVKDFTVEFPDNVDYVQVTVHGSSTITTAGTPGIPGLPARPEILLRAASPATPESNDGPGMPALPAMDRLVLPAREAIPGTTGTPGTSRSSPQSYTVWLPSMFKISCTLIVQHNPKDLRSRFNLPAYINGANNQKDFI